MHASRNYGATNQHGYQVTVLAVQQLDSLDGIATPPEHDVVAQGRGQGCKDSHFIKQAAVAPQMVEKLHDAALQIERHLAVMKVLAHFRQSLCEGGPPHIERANERRYVGNDEAEGGYTDTLGAQHG